MKRICLVINSLAGGGAERVVQTLTSHWARNGWTVEVVTLEGVEDSYALDSSVARRSLLSGRFSRGVAKILLIPLQAFELASILRTRQYDCVISFLVRSNIVHGCTRAFGCRHKIVMSERSHADMHYPGFGLRSVVMRWMIKRAYRHADRIVAISQGVRTSLLRFGVLPERVSVIPNPVDIDRVRRLSQVRFDFDWSGSRAVVTVGRLIPLKDHRTLLRAFAYVRQHIDAKLVIIGDGPLRESLEDEVGQLGLQNSVHFTGWLNNPFAAMAQCDVFVLPSRFEGFGNVLVEAMACGLPVVSTDCGGGPREILRDGWDGELVQVGDSRALADAVIGLLNDSARRITLVRRSRLRVRDYSVEQISQQYEQLLSA